MAACRSREIEAMAVGLEETMDEDMIARGRSSSAYFVNRLIAQGVPVITPPGGLGVHIDAMRFVDHVPQTRVPAGAPRPPCTSGRASAAWSAAPCPNRRDLQGNEILANMELLRLAVPRRVFTLSQFKYAVDRIAWLLREPRPGRRACGSSRSRKVLRFFFGKMAPIDNWGAALAEAYRKDFGEY